jgi:acyl-CoA synthetase (AMP-forming)/AMP-acid ligase II
MEEEELFVVGRATDVIILNGKNHAPEAIEAAVDGLDGLRRGCVAAVGLRREEEHTESLILFVEEDKRATESSLASLSSRCEDAVLKQLQLQAQVLPLPAGTLPRTSSGKIRRREALALYKADKLLPPEKMGALKILGAMWESRKYMPKGP